MKYRDLILKVIFFVGILQINSQNKPINYLVESTSALSSEKTMPFWLTSNTNGQIPNSNGIQFNASVFSNFSENKSGFNFSYKAAFNGYFETKDKLFIDELFFGLRYSKLQLDLGIKHVDVLWNGLSSTNGNIAYSNNARAFPGYNFRLIDFVPIPFVKKWFSFKGSYGDFIMNDTRFVDNTLLHMKSFILRTKFNNRFEFLLGLYHYAQWGGTSSTFGKQPSGFKNYFNIVAIRSGGEDASTGDKRNALGNHLGTYLVQFNYRADNNNFSFYWSHPFEDRSGRELNNLPDGLYGLSIEFKKPRALITHLVTEFTYTKDMSGDQVDTVGENGFVFIGNGRDNYFNNGVYRSGWTYFGKTIGSPYFTPNAMDDNGITNGIVVGDNRFMAFNLGVQGNIKDIDYKLILSHVTYFGWFENEYDPYPYQFSGLLELKFLESVSLPFNLTIGGAFDTGTYRPIKFGAFLKISKAGVF